MREGEKPEIPFYKMTVFHLVDHWHVTGKTVLTKTMLFPGYWNINFLPLNTQYLQI